MTLGFAWSGLSKRVWYLVSSSKAPHCIDTVLSHKAVSRSDYTDNGDCPNPFCPFFHYPRNSSLFSACGLQWGSPAAHRQALGDGVLAHGVCLLELEASSCPSRGRTKGPTSASRALSLPLGPSLGWQWLLLPSRPAGSAAVTVPREPLPLVATAFAMCVLTPEGTRSQPRLWGGFWYVRCSIARG